MKILITGASGFIGGFLVEAALQQGWEVWAGVRKTSDKHYLTQQELKFIDLNYTDVEVLTQQIKLHIAEHGAWDYVIHNAGITKCMDETDYYRINHLYTAHLIQALLLSGNKPSKFLYMSSMGAVGPGNDETGAPLTLLDSPSPVSEYGRSKLMAEDYIRTQTDLPWIILRPTGVYGPRERDYYNLLKMINMGVNVSIGFKHQQLNFIYVKDLARVCILSLKSPHVHKTWFVADGDIHTSKDFSKLLQLVLKKKKVITLRIPLSIVKGLSIFMDKLGRLTQKTYLLNADKYKVMKQRNWTCDITALEQELPFKATYNLQRGMEETVAWYVENGWL